MEQLLFLSGLVLPAIAVAGQGIRRRTHASTERRATDIYLDTLLADVAPRPFRRSHVLAPPRFVPAPRGAARVPARILAGAAVPA